MYTQIIIWHLYKQGPATMHATYNFYYSTRVIKVSSFDNKLVQERAGAGFSLLSFPMYKISKTSQNKPKKIENIFWSQTWCSKPKK